MPFFAYKARSARGEPLQGVLEAADVNAVADQLFNTGITPIDITETAKPAVAGEAGSGWGKLFEERIKPIDVQLFSRQMYTRTR